MRKLIFIAVILMATSVMGGDKVTSYTQKFGNGYLTRRSDGSTMTTQRFGSGYIQRESFRSGRSATHTATPFGRGYMIRSTGAYIRKP